MFTNIGKKKALSQVEINKQTAELIEQLATTKKDEVIDLIYEQCKDIYQKERERSPSLDTKGATLLSACCVAITLILTIGGLFIKDIEDVPIYFVVHPIHWFSVMYVVVGILLFAAMLICLLSIKSRSDFRAISGEDIFNKNAITKEKEFYQRHMIAVYWKFFTNNFNVNQNKAKTLMNAQIVFFVANIALLLTMIMIGIYTYKIGGQ